VSNEALASASAPPLIPPSPKKAEIDALFAGYEKQLPKAHTLSDSNGFGLRCGEEHVTYNRLQRGAEAVPLESDADLVSLVPWARSPNECIRDIALNAILRRVPFEQKRLVIPSMDDVEHYLYHSIFVSLITYLEEHHVAFDPAVFAGMRLAPQSSDWEQSMLGDWDEDFREHKNFRVHANLAKDTLRVMTEETNHDPDWPDRTVTFHVARVRVDDQRQLVVESDTHAESTAKGMQGSAQNVAVELRFWPVEDDVVWFDQGYAGRWIMLRRAKR
jgi:hypothetical protein